MRRLTFLDAAQDDLAEIGVNIAEASGSIDVADAFVGRIIEQCEHLAALPGLLGRARPELLPDIRSFPFGDYIIFFRYKADLFEVVDILHGARDIDAQFGRGPGAT